MGSMTDYTTLLNMNMHMGDHDPAHLHQQQHLSMHQGSQVHDDQSQLHLVDDPSHHMVQDPHDQVQQMLGHDMVPGSAPQQSYNSTHNVMPLTKTCSKCKITKMSEEFFRDKSKPDGMYSQCKHCATAEEKRRREARQPPVTDPSHIHKRCTRCGIEKPANAFCRNKRSFDGLYSQCRACVSSKDKDRRQKMLQTRPEPTPRKMCSRCNTEKTCDDFYRDASKPDGLQTYCKPCLCAKHKELRDRKRLRQVESHMCAASGNLHQLDGGQVMDANGDIYAGHNLHPVYGPDGTLQGHVAINTALAEGTPAELAAFSGDVAQGYPIEGVEGQGGEYTLQQAEYDPQQVHAYNCSDGTYSSQDKDQYHLQQAADQGYLTQQTTEQQYQHHSQGYGHDATGAFHLGAQQYGAQHVSQGHDHQQGYQTGNEAQGYDGQHVDGSVHHGHEDLVLSFGTEPGEPVDGYGDTEGQLKRFKGSSDPAY